jgi:hypothetical protein
MFFAALTSYPHFWQWKCSPSRFDSCVNPQSVREQRWDVWFGATCFAVTPRSDALYSTYSNRRLKNRDRNTVLAGPLVIRIGGAFTRDRNPIFDVHAIAVLVGVLVALVANGHETGRSKLEVEGFVLGAFAGRCVELKCVDCVRAYGLCS